MFPCVLIQVVKSRLARHFGDDAVEAHRRDIRDVMALIAAAEERGEGSISADSTHTLSFSFFVSRIILCSHSIAHIL